LTAHHAADIGVHADRACTTGHDVDTTETATAPFALRQHSIGLVTLRGDAAELADQCHGSAVATGAARTAQNRIHVGAHVERAASARGQAEGAPAAATTCALRHDTVSVGTLRDN